jgi:hypothetical protein
LRGTRSNTLYAVIDQGAPDAVDLTTRLPQGVEIHPYPIHFDVGDFVASFTFTAN